MPVVAAVDDSVTLEVGDTWDLGVYVTDADGDALAGATVAAMVTTPSGTTATPTLVEDGTGLWLGSVTLAAAGRHVAVVTVSGVAVGVVSLTAFAGSVTTAAAMPTLAECLAYLGDTSMPGDEVTRALDAESAAQRARCNIPAVYPADLREALLRRVARNLAARSVPVASFTSFEGGVTSTRLSARDAEVSRLEGSYRRRPLA